MRVDGQSRHALTISSRSSAEISGVEDVECFSGEIVVVKTDLGELTIAGAGLRVALLDISGGRLLLEGRVDAVEYGGKARPRGMLARIFK